MLAALLVVVCAASPPSDARGGSYCTYVALRALDVPVGSFAEFDRLIGPPSQNGYSLEQLAAVVRKHGAHALAVRATLESLEQRPGRFACIALLGDMHFACISDVKGATVTLVDPPRSYDVQRETIVATWDGTALLVSATPLDALDVPQSNTWSRVIVFTLSSIAALVILYWAVRKVGSVRHSRSHA